MKRIEEFLSCFYKFCGSTAFDVTDTIIKTRVSEKEVPHKNPKTWDEKQELKYWGWNEKNEEDIICLIQPCFFMFDMQFPYGVELEVERNAGRIISLDIEILETYLPEE